MKKLINVLESIGLSYKESIIYSSILKNWTSSLTDISKTSGIKRTTLYWYLDLLLSKWFISKTIKSKRILYIVENPENIFKELVRKKDNFLNFLPEMVKLYNNNTNKPSTNIFEWKNAIKKIYKEIWESFSTIYAFVSPKDFINNINLEDRLYFLESIKNNDNTICNLVENTIEWKKFKKDFWYSPMKLKFLPKDFELSVDILVYGNKVAMISFENLNWIVIDNKEITTFIKNVHKLLWSICW